MASLAAGSVVPHLNMQDIRKMTLPELPTLEKQIAIGDTLGSMDDKIELNQQMNRTLEAVGEAVFRRWFVDFEFPDEEGRPYKASGGEIVDSELGELPIRWRIGKLKEVADLVMGISPKGTSYNEAGEGVPLLNGAADFQGTLVVPRKWTTEPIRICKKGSLLFCIRATIGNLVFADREYCLGIYRICLLCFAGISE
jgi:type I restriction enzyme S subunit